MKSLEAMLSGQPGAAPAAPAAPAQPVQPAIQPSAPILPAPAPIQPLPGGLADSTIGTELPDRNGQSSGPSAVSSPTAKVATVPKSSATPPSTQPALDLTPIMLEVVTEKTGYPTEMLEMGMALDTDLGIDSIKRVEILAAMRERVPTLPEFDPNEMTALNTLGEIVDYMDAQLGGQPAADVGLQLQPQRSRPSTSRRSCWKSSPKRPVTRPRCSKWAWRWTPTWASTPSSASRSWPPCASACRLCPSSIPTR